MLNYADDVVKVAGARQIGQTFKLLFKWKGSIYELLWLHFIIYCAVSVGLGALYRYVMNDEVKWYFELMAHYCEKHIGAIPLSLMVSFYTGTCISRWWSINMKLPDMAELFARSSIYFALSQQGKIYMGLFNRYILLSWMLCMRHVSVPLRDKFPSLWALHHIGLITERERVLLEEASETSYDNLATEPLLWISALLEKAGTANDVVDTPRERLTLTEAVMHFRARCRDIVKFHDSSIPLPFTQAVLLGVYTFSFVNLVGSQFGSSGDDVFQGFVPILPALELFGYVAWVKMGVVVMNPFGGDQGNLDLIYAWKESVQLACKFAAVRDGPHTKDLLDEALSGSVADTGKLCQLQCGDDSDCKNCCQSK